MVGTRNGRFDEGLGMRGIFVMIKLNRDETLSS